MYYLSVYVNLFKELFSFASYPDVYLVVSSIISFDTNFRHGITEASFVLPIWLIKFVLESGCKGITKNNTVQVFWRKSFKKVAFLGSIWLKSTKTDGFRGKIAINEAFLLFRALSPVSHNLALKQAAVDLRLLSPL